MLCCGYSRVVPVQRFPALAHHPYRRYLFGSFISNVGNMLQATAIALHVFSISGGSSFAVGMLGLVRVGPLLLFSLIGGIVADHHDRRSVMLVTQSAMAAIALALASFEFFGITTLWLIYLTVATSAVARAFDGPARQSMVANLVPMDILPNAIGLNGISWRLSDVLGPLIAALIIFTKGLPALGPYGTCYLLNLVSFSTVLISIWLLPARPPQLNGSKISNLRELKQAIHDGLAFVHHTPVLRSAMWIDFWATFFSSADALIPAFASRILHMGEAGAGILQSSIAIGALIGAMFMTWIPSPRHPGRWVIAMIAIYGFFTVLFGFATSVVVAVICLAGTGFSDMVSTVLRQTIRQLATPDHMRGRMSATSMLFNISGPQLGDFEAGAVALWTGERWSVAIGGIACLLVGGHWYRGSALRDYRYGATSEHEGRSNP